MKPGGWRVRVIDDFKRNEANSAARAFEAATVDTADDITVGVRELERALWAAGTHGGGDGPHTDVGLDDFVSAFKTIAPAGDQRWLSWRSRCRQHRCQSLRNGFKFLPETMHFIRISGLLRWQWCTAIPIVPTLIICSIVLEVPI